MPISIAVGTVTATTAALTLTGRTGVQPEIQVAIRPDFAWCVCPIFPVSAADAQTLNGLNQNATYYVRARNILDGAGNRDAWSTIQSFRTPQAVAWASETANLRVDNAIIVSPEPILEYNTSGTVSGYPIDNLTRPSPVAFRRMEHGSNGSFYISVRIGTAPIDTIALLNTNLRESTLVAIYGDTTLSAVNGASPAFSQVFPSFRASPNLPGRPGYHGLFKLSSKQTYPWWRLQIEPGAVGSTTGGMLHAEHLVIGLNRGTKAMAVEKKESTVDLGTLERSRSGLMDRQAGFKLRRAEFDIAMLDENAFEQNYGDLWRDINEPMLVVPNGKAGPYLHDRILYGDFVGGGVTQNTSTRFSRSFIIESLI